MVDDFTQRGIELFAVSMNSEELAKRTVEEWGLDRLTVGFELELADAERWGLFVSAALNDKEPPMFNEPGLFFVRPDGTLYSSIVQTMPFSRPPAKALLGMVDWVIENEYPPRGGAAFPST